MASPAFAQLDAPTQLAVIRALDKCPFPHCDSTAESVASDILKTRAHRAPLLAIRKAVR